MSGHRIKLESELWEKIKLCAVKGGYSSPEEFVIHALEKEIARLGDSQREADAEAEVKKQLRGLGYIE